MLSQHETNVFARCIELSTIDGKKRSTWSFLSAVKKTGVPLSRRLLVDQVRKDTSLLALVNTYARTAVKLTLEGILTATDLLMSGFNACLSLYTAIILEVINVKPLSDTQLRTIFPSIIR